MKDELCASFGVSPGLNLQSLERELDRFLLERVKRRERELIDALPKGIRTAGNNAAKSLEKEILAALGHGFAEMQAQAAREVAVLEKDKAILHRRIEQFEADAAEMASEIGRLTDVVSARERELEDVGRALDDAKGTIRDIETATGAETRILRGFARLLAEHGVAVGLDTPGREATSQPK